MESPLNNNHRVANAFTLVELLVVIAIIAILAGILLPSLSSAKETGRRIACVNHLRQLNIAMKMYADEHEDSLPPHTDPNRWPQRMLPYYEDVKILVCPSDGDNPHTFDKGRNLIADASPRSYFFNAWNDHMQKVLSNDEWEKYKIGTTERAMRQSDIPNPSDTVTFAEKVTASGHFHMDFWELDDLKQIAQTRHSLGVNPLSGKANYAFADGGVRTLEYGQSLAPLNLWATTPEWRTNAIVIE